MFFEIIGDITEIEIIAVGSSIRDLPRLRKTYGRGRWRKLKGIAIEFGLRMVPSAMLNYTGTRLTASARRK